MLKTLTIIQRARQIICPCGNSHEALRCKFYARTDIVSLNSWSFYSIWIIFCCHACYSMVQRPAQNTDNSLICFLDLENDYYFTMHEAPESWVKAGIYEFHLHFELFFFCAYKTLHRDSRYGMLICYIYSVICIVYVPNIKDLTSFVTANELKALACHNTWEIK